MKTILRSAVLAATVTMLAVATAWAEPLGTFQTTDRKMDYRLETCGNGKDLCVTLTAARGSAATPHVRPYIGKMIVNQAKASGKNRWKGKMRVGQYDLSGTLTLTPGKKFVMSGCVYVVMCEDFTLIPAK
jgi:uncharacterized protein (DUF2147 family)